LPETVQGLIAARLDMLSPEEKAVLQDAAVVGKSFWPVVVAAVGSHDSIEQALRGLERKEFVRRQRRSTVVDETEYAFRHVLVRDVAYGQIPRASRAEKHQRVAEWLESLSERSDDLAEMLAHHYLAAVEFAKASRTEDAGLFARARAALRDAGDRATTLNAFDAAARFYERALALAVDESERAELLFRQGRAQYLAFGEGGREPLEQAVAALLDRGDRLSAAEGESILADLDFLDGRHDLALERHRRAGGLVDDAPPSRLKGSVLVRFARFLMTAGDQQAISVGREALEIAEEMRSPELVSYALNVVGTARTNVGDDGGFEDLERSLAIAIDGDFAPEILRGYNNLASSLADYGELERSYELMNRGREAAERFGYLMRIRWFKVAAVEESYWSGRWDEAVNGADEFLEKEPGQLPYLEPSCLFHRGTILVARDDTARGLADTARAVELARTIKDPQVLFPALASRAAALFSSGDADEAARVADELLRIWRHGEKKLLAGDWVAPLARVLTAVGRGDEFIEAARSADAHTRWLDAATAFAGGDFVGAADLYQQIGSRPDEAYARLRSGIESEVRRALEFYRSVDATRYIREGEALLAATA
jgi:tetratricopeptide (TPR) repeat protein